MVNVVVVEEVMVAVVNVVGAMHVVGMVNDHGCSERGVCSACGGCDGGGSERGRRSKCGGRSGDRYCEHVEYSVTWKLFIWCCVGERKVKGSGVSEGQGPGGERPGRRRRRTALPAVAALGPHSLYSSRRRPHVLSLQSVQLSSLVFITGHPFSRSFFFCPIPSFSYLFSYHPPHVLITSFC